MPLVSLAPLLADARRQGSAVGAFSCLNLETAAAIVAAAQDLRAPAVIAFTARHAAWMDLPALAAAVRSLAERADVPLALHLDHAEETAVVETAMEAGFTSVMFDASGLPQPEKVRLTRELVRRAHARGVSVEAELDHIAQAGVPGPGGGSAPDARTDPAEAAAFASETGIDVLAVAIGNIHHQAPGEAVLDLERLRAIAAAAPCALSLHGGSGVDDETLRAAIAAGIVKVSYFTRLARAAAEAIRRELAFPRADLAAVLRATKGAFRDVILERLAALGHGR